MQMYEIFVTIVAIFQIKKPTLFTCRPSGERKKFTYTIWKVATPLPGTTWNVMLNISAAAVG